ncbi:polysaccharide biosynthesis/export family protein [Sphingomonas jatrophae]|uniref:Polysaccharide export outer membrane protein n=1 Tax=Sphingomonas jatrophae TaxID=1166337 RepID=A0A1I6L5Y0_9SPHN|nr:polysaccharide biosynthesis/export family protein [Sphingomonas jatrophae]SFR98856.1 polysaccharide export outer membrane protein [Sphingomonas jatrophae]
MRFRQMLFGVAAVATLLSGCGSVRDKRMSYNPTNFSAPDELPVQDMLATYRVGPGDVVTVSVFGVDSLSGDRAVDPAGNLTMPLIGAVPAAGKSTQELGTELASRLGARYLQQPQVTVTIKTAVARTVTVDGSVGAPGLYPVPDKTTLLKTIAMARGTSQGANPKKVVVFRQINGQRNAAAFDLTTIRDGIDPDPVIYANDVVVVDGRETNATWMALLQAVPVIGLFARVY